MKKRKVIGAALLSLSLMAGGMNLVPVYADGTKVVTLGADLTDAQKKTMMNYFKVNSGEAQIITITNQDERKHLGGYVPLEQIGTRTVSCAYVKPTSSGGIKVRTANLNWVTGNMIASSLSTSGVKNCEVIAACPFEVSGTGALTGVQMAYETATGVALDENKKNIATQEIVVTGNLAAQVGRADAVALINDSKIDIIQNNVTEHTEITNIVNNVANNNNVLLTQEQLEQIADFLQQVADEDYDYDDVAETLETIEANTSEDVEEETEAEAEGEPEAEAGAEPEEYDEDSILNDIDESVLGENIVTSSTEDQSLEEETYNNDGVEEESWETFGGDETDINVEDVEYGNTDNTETDDSFSVNIEDIDNGESSETDSFETDGFETFPEDTDGQAEVAEDLTAMLSEQSRSQYEKAVKFAKGEFGGDTEALREVMGDDFLPSVTLTGRLDDEKTQKLIEKFTKYYLEILAHGTGSYIPNGEEKYTNVELCMMDEFLKKLFSVDGAFLDPTEEDVLTELLPEEKEGLYKDSIKFFEAMYGETSVTEDSYPQEDTYTETDNYENGSDTYTEESYNSEDYEDYGDYEDYDSYEDEGYYEEETGEY